MWELIKIGLFAHEFISSACTTTNTLLFYS